MTQDGKALPKVVALMPAWNAESFIVPVLESLAGQTYSNLQVLISDDASTDRTAEICEEFAARHANFQLVRQTRNLGWIGNSNALFSEAHGEYFFFAFHDDRPRPNYVERLVNALEANPRAVLSFSDMATRFVDPKDPRPEGIRVYPDLDGITDRVERGVCAARRDGESPPSGIGVTFRGLFRASAALQVGGMRHNMAGGEAGASWSWLLHLSLLGEFVRVPEPLIEKFFLPTGLTASWGYSTWRSLGALVACIRETRRANLPLLEELEIQRALVAYALKRGWRRFHRLKRQWWRSYK